MFCKYTTSLINLDLYNVKLEHTSILMTTPETCTLIYSCGFDSERLASFAYGRIIHALLLGWNCVDITPSAIQRLLDETSQLTPPVP